MDDKTQLVVVDDDAEIRQLLTRILSEYNFKVFPAKDGVELFSILEKHQIHLIVLDLMLPGEDGLSLCRKLRDTNRNIAIIMLTAAGDDTDRIVGLEVGADDYIAKPFNPRELVARIKAVLRRSHGYAHHRNKDDISHQSKQKVEFAGWTLDMSLRKLVDPEDIEVELSTGEYQLLVAFINNPHIILSRDQLLDYTQNRPAGPFDRSIDVQVSRLRQKIEKTPKKPELIKTVRGGGYMFTAKVNK